MSTKSQAPKDRKRTGTTSAAPPKRRPKARAEAVNPVDERGLVRKNAKPRSSRQSLRGS